MYCVAHKDAQCDGLSITHMCDAVAEEMFEMLVYDVSIYSV